MKLTNQQLIATNHFNGPALVLAVPGSGKTTILINRILNLVNNHNIKAESILNITFNKSQANDMKTRYLQSFGNQFAKSPRFSTIHSFSYDIIKYYLKKHNKSMRLIEEDNNFNKYILIRRLYMEICGEYLRDDQVTEFFSVYGFYKNSGDLPDIEKIGKVDFSLLMSSYEKYKEVHHYFDFDDMLTLSYDYICEDASLIKQIKNKYKYFQIDEGQDTSLIQMKLISKIAFPENNIFIVADDDQSIYGFRGANPGYLLNFSKHFENSNIFYIEENHRSSKDIVALSNQFIKSNIERFDKNVTTNSSLTHPISLVNCKSLQKQYTYLESSIKNIQKKYPSDTMAVLFRNNISILALSSYLSRKGYEFKTSNISYDLINNFILSDIIDIITFANDQCNLDIFNRIYFKLNSYIKKSQVNILNTYDYRMNIFDRLLDNPCLEDFYVERFKHIKKIFNKIANSNIKYAIQYIFNDLEYSEYIDQKVHTDHVLLSIDMIVESYLNLFSHDNNIEEMLNTIERIKEILSRRTKYASTLSLSTIHQSKGLEFDHVFVIDLVDGEFPGHKRFESREDKIKYIEEERRIFYVAITRAKKTLTLLAPTKRNGIDVSRSRFFMEIRKMSSKK